MSASTLWCAICGGVLQAPTDLMCGHRACAECLSRVAALERARTLGSTDPEIAVRCPLCDITTRLPRAAPTSDASDAAASAAERGLDATIHGAPPVPPPLPPPAEPEPKPVLLCDNCETEAATARCEVCGTLCDACWDEVHRSKVHRSHAKLPLLPETPSQQQQSGDRAPSPVLSSSSSYSSLWECQVHPGKDLDAYCFTCRTLTCAACALSRQHAGHETVLVAEHTDVARRKLADSARRLQQQSQALERAADAAQKAASRVQSVQEAFERGAEELVRMLSEAIAARVAAEVERQRALAEEMVGQLTAQHKALAAIARDAGSFAAVASAVTERRTEPPAGMFLRSAAFWRLAHGYGPDIRVKLDPVTPEHVPPRLRDAPDADLIEALLGLSSKPAAAQEPPSSPTLSAAVASTSTAPKASSPVAPASDSSPVAAPAPSPTSTASPGPRRAFSHINVPAPAPSPPQAAVHNRAQSAGQQQASAAQQRFLMRPHVTMAVIGRPGADSSSSSAVSSSAEAEVVAVASPSPMPLTLRGTDERLAGSSREGMADGVGEASLFSRPGGIALDTTKGLLYVTDSRNNVIRRVRIADKTVETVAGSSTAGIADGLGSSEARFNQPAGIAHDPRTGLLYVADRENHTIRVIDPAAGFRVTTLAGSGWPGLRDGIGRAAQLNRPWGLCIDGSGALFVADHGNNTIRRIDPTNGAVATVTRVGKVSGPAAVAIDSDGALYICEAEGRTVRKLARGAKEAAVMRGCASAAGAFTFPSAITVDSALSVYIADWGCDRVKRIDQRTGTVETVPLSFNKPISLAISPDAKLLVADWHALHKAS